MEQVSRDGENQRDDQRNKQSTRKHGLAFREKHHHGKEGNEKFFKCNQCPKSFVKQSDLVRHVRVHSGERPFKCPHCSKSFSQIGHRNQHVRDIHLKLTPFKCTQCGKTFKQRSTLETHTRIHLQIKPYQCVFCGNSFRHSSALQGHIRIHIRESPYSCPYDKCEQSFPSKSALNEHCHRHQEELPFRCNLCSAKFSYRHYLMFHLRIVHKLENVGRGIRHICLFCQKEFPTKVRLENHIRGKINERPFTCSDCDVKPFSAHTSLFKHKRTVHRKKKNELQ